MANDFGIECEGVAKRYRTAAAVDGASLQLETGKVMALLGPSGCGKTTLLRLIAGFERPDEGVIRVRGREVAGPGVWVPPERRHIGFVFQDYALFPHLSVEKNIGFGLRGMDSAARRRRVEAMLELVGLKTERHRAPHQLSGGQQQRVALARALAPDPTVVLLDEPFSNLDALLRLQVREDLRRILAEAGATAILVTHDREEALHLGQVVGVMARGRILECGAPREVYLKPRSLESARIVGSVNFLRGESQGVTIRCALGQLPLARPCRLGAMDILLRPESILARPWPASGKVPGASGIVQDLQFHGNHQHIVVGLDGGEVIRVKVGPEQFFQSGQRVALRAPDPVLCFPRDPQPGDSQV